MAWTRAPYAPCTPRHQGTYPAPSGRDPGGSWLPLLSPARPRLHPAPPAGRRPGRRAAEAVAAPGCRVKRCLPQTELLCVGRAIYGLTQVPQGSDTCWEKQNRMTRFHLPHLGSVFKTLASPVPPPLPPPTCPPLLLLQSPSQTHTLSSRPPPLRREAGSLPSIR